MCDFESVSGVIHLIGASGVIHLIGASVNEW